MMWIANARGENLGIALVGVARIANAICGRVAVRLGCILKKDGNPPCALVLGLNRVLRSIFDCH